MLPEKTYFKAIGTLIIKPNKTLNKKEENAVNFEQQSSVYNRSEDNNPDANTITSSSNARQLLLKAKIFRVKSVNSPQKLNKMMGKRIFNGEQTTIQEIYERVVPHNASHSISRL